MRTSTHRTKKYKKKLSGDVAKHRADSYGKEQKKRFALAVGEQVEIENEVKKMVSDLNLVYYIIFAKQVVKASKKFQSTQLFNEMELLQNTWEDRGLDINILNTIKTYYVPAYKPVIPPVYFRLDVSLLDGPDVLA